MAYMVPSKSVFLLFCSMVLSELKENQHFPFVFTHTTFLQILHVSIESGMQEVKFNAKYTNIILLLLLFLQLQAGNQTCYFVDYPA